MVCIVFAFCIATAVASAAPTVTTLVNFDATNGDYPLYGPLVQGMDGNFYGTTVFGGANGDGTVFKITPQGTLSTLYSFCSLGGAQCTDGLDPEAGLVQGPNGSFYGTTSGGGVNSCASYGLMGPGCGTIFEITPAGILTPLHSFNGSDGLAPVSWLVWGNNGALYGTTEYGGAFPCTFGSDNTGCGTVFEITPTGTLTTLVNFDDTDGSVPSAGLVEATDGNFYGTTLARSGLFNGTVFKTTPSGALTTLYDFCSQGCGPGGGIPESGVVQDTDGNFYGTTHVYGYGYGTVFKITPRGALTTLHNFCSQPGCTDGANPVGGLVQGPDGNFYGTTNSGGTNSCDYGGAYTGCGTVFEITPTGRLTTLHSFNGTDGDFPVGTLVQGTDGNFYGTTQNGGTDFSDCSIGCGTVFRLSTGFGPFVGTNPTSAAVGQLVIILGYGLDDATSVTFNGTTATFQAYSTYISTAVPTGATTGPVSVVTPGGTLYSNKNFTVLNSGPAVTLSPTSLKFGDQAVNTTSAAKTVTLKNTGRATLDISDIAPSADFAISANTCGATLAPGKTCKVSVTFTPAKVGSATGTLSFADNAPNSPQTVALSGKGVEPATLTPASATYALQVVGTTSAAKTFTLTNNQNVTLTSIAISTTGDFAVSATTCGTSLAAQGKCTISVTFTPTATGTRTAELKVSDSASNSRQTSNLKGTGK